MTNSTTVLTTNAVLNGATLTDEQRKALETVGRHRVEGREYYEITAHGVDHLIVEEPNGAITVCVDVDSDDSLLIIDARTVSQAYSALAVAIAYNLN